MIKTNAVRILDKEKIVYELKEYDISDSMIDAVSVAIKVGVDPNILFKTLVLEFKSSLYICVIPSNSKLDLKKAASTFNVKSLSMLPQKDLLSKTGYIHGGCSPINMKKLYPTVIHQSCLNYDSIIVSAGKIGYQIKIKVSDLLLITHSMTADIIE